MAKKGTARKKHKKVAEELPPAVITDKDNAIAARPVDYLRAAVGLMWGWIKTHKRRAGLLVLALVMIGGLLGVVLKPTKKPLTNDEIVTVVNKTLSITGDGHPAILTVEDKVRATQPFLDAAENGDKVLLYYKAKKAVLFRPGQDVIIHQGSYTPPAAKVFIRKGTTDSGKVDVVKNRLSGVKDIKLTSQDESTKKDYKGITLVSVTDRYDDKLRELETLFGVKTVRLPAGESFPDADILIIAGD